MEYVAKRYESGLVKSLSKGNIMAFNLLYREYSSRLYHFALNCLKSEVEAEEIVQETFIKIWQKRGELKNELSFKSYLFTIAYNNIKKKFRASARIAKYLESHTISCADNKTSESIDHSSLCEHLNQLVNQMPGRRRDIFIKSRIEGLNNDEIARELKIKKKTVENQLTHALRFIREKLENESA